MSEKKRYHEVFLNEDGTYLVRVYECSNQSGVRDTVLVELTGEGGKDVALEALDDWRASH